MKAPTLEALERRPTSAMSERDLARGYSRTGVFAPVSRTESCACGGSITVDDRDDHGEIATALVVHYRSTPHAQWRVGVDEKAR